MKARFHVEHHARARALTSLECIHSRQGNACDVRHVLDELTVKQCRT
jgi:hypothetical protein